MTPDYVAARHLLLTISIGKRNLASHTNFMKVISDAVYGIVLMLIHAPARDSFMRTS
jgi:hypothetical protein